MFDILLYLYDNYLVADHYPDPDTLSRKLLAAGFETEEIDQALSWLAALGDLRADDPLAENRGQRGYSAEERRRIAPDGLGFLIFLENDGLLPPQAREWVIHQALALEDDEISADQIKWIALLAISYLFGPGDALWLEDIVRGSDEFGDGWTPTLH